MWTEDLVMTPFRNTLDGSKWAGWPSPSNQKAAEALSRYIVVNMYAKAVQGIPVEDAVKWAAGELKTVCGG